MSFRVVIARFDPKREDELVDELCQELDISEEEAQEMLETTPVTVVSGLEEEDAEDVADILEDAGAKVRIVEVRPKKKKRKVSKRTREDVLEDDDDDDYIYGPEHDRPRKKAKRKKSKLSLGQIVVLAAGSGLILVLIVFLVLDVFSGGGAGGNYRGSGANSSLVREIEPVARQFASGFTPDDDPAHGELDANRSVTLRETVPGGACYVWIGRSPDGTDLDLAVKLNNNVISEDQAEDNYPVVRYCAGSETTLDVEVKMFAGGGDWVVQRYVLRGEEGADQLTLMHGLYASMFIKNGQPVGDTKRLKMPSGGEREVDLELDSQWCYLVLGVSGPGTDLDLAIHNPEGQEVIRDERQDNYPLVRICPSKSGTYKLKLMMYAGSSDAVYRLYKGKLGGAPGGQQSAPPLNLPKNR